MKINLTNIIEHFNNLSDQVRYCILVGVVMLIILLDLFFLVSPQINSIANVNDQIKKLSQDTQEVLADRARIVFLKKNLQEARVQLKWLQSKVRPIQEVPAILGTISSIANECDVKIDQLAPDKAHQQALKKASYGKYYALPIVIKARCGYHNFGRFLNKLENEDLYFIMKDFIIQNDDTDIHMHQFSLTIKVILVDRTSRFKNL